jgi:8-oxo-dGTP diphosphatase
VKIRETSAGGVVMREGQVLLLRRRTGGRVMPKGRLEPGESEAEAAVREVREETGLTCVILRVLGTSRYQYPTVSRNLVHKSVHWFLMEFRDGALEVESLFRDAGSCIRRRPCAC